MRPFRPTSDDISRRIVARVMALPEAEVAGLASQVLGGFANAELERRDGAPAPDRSMY